MDSIKIVLVFLIVQMGSGLTAQQNSPFELQTDSNPLGLSVVTDGSAQYLYSTQKQSGVVGYRISGNRLRKVSHLSKAKLAGLDAMNVFQFKKHLFIALGDFFGRDSRSGFAIVDIQKPSRPRVLSTWASKGGMQGAAAVVANDRYAFVGAMSKGVMAFDISNKKQVKFLSTFLPDIHFPRKNPGKIQMPNARGLFLDGKTLYVAFDAGGLRILDISNPKQMKEVGRYVNQKMGLKQQAFNNLVVRNGFAFVGVDYAGLEILDVRNPNQIKQVAWWNPWEAEKLKNLWFNSPGHINEVRLDAAGKRIYLSGGDSEIACIDVSNVQTPKLIKMYGKEKNKRGVWGITLSREKVFAAYIRTIVPFQGHWSGIKVLDR